MTLEPGPGIPAEFGAVRSGTPPSAAPDGVPAPDSATGAFFDSLVEAWLAPAKDEDDAGDLADVAADPLITAASLSVPLLPPVPVPPLPVTVPLPQAQYDTAAADSTDRVTSAVTVDAPPPDSHQAAARAPQIDPALTPPPAAPREAALQGSPTATEGETATPATQARREVSCDRSASDVTPDSSHQGIRVLNLRELHARADAPSAQAPRTNRSTPETIDVTAESKNPAPRARLAQVLPPSVMGRTAATSSAIVASPSVAAVPASPGSSPAPPPSIPAPPSESLDPGSIAQRIEAVALPPFDAAVAGAPQTEPAEAPDGIPVQKPTRPAIEVPQRSADKPAAPPPANDTNLVAVRLATQTEQRAVAGSLQTSADVPATQPADPATTLTARPANPRASNNSIGQDESGSRGFRVSPPGPARLDAPARPTIDAVASNESGTGILIRSGATAPGGASVEALGSTKPNSIDPVANNHDVPVATPPDAHDPETTDDREREPNRDRHRREAVTHTDQSERSHVAHSFGERPEPRELAASPMPPARPVVTLVHGTAPAWPPVTSLQPLDVPPSDVPLPARPGPDTADRIVQSLKLQVQRGGGDAILHLQPDHLGPVAISLRVENGAVSAVITAEQPAVVEWLQSNQQSLRDGLQASGLQLERFVVQRDGQSPPDRQRRDWADSRRRDLRRRSPQTDSTFEISV